MGFYRSADLIGKKKEAHVLRKMEAKRILPSERSVCFSSPAKNWLDTAKQGESKTGLLSSPPPASPPPNHSPLGAAGTAAAEARRSRAAAPLLEELSSSKRSKTSFFAVRTSGLSPGYSQKCRNERLRSRPRRHNAWVRKSGCGWSGHTSGEGRL